MPQAQSPSSPAEAADKLNFHPNFLALMERALSQHSPRSFTAFITVKFA
jgi:hypothetical protein